MSHVSSSQDRRRRPRLRWTTGRSALARAGFEVIGFDINPSRILELQSQVDRTREVNSEELRAKTLRLSSDPTTLRAADFFIVTVPTPIDNACRPDLSKVFAASQTVGVALNPGDIVVYETTVYLGATEDKCIPLLESSSGLKVGQEFTVGFSPVNRRPKIGRRSSLNRGQSSTPNYTWESDAPRLHYG
jgi:UDP-N-acetyl-D-galactosamine dehydrogenase